MGWGRYLLLGDLGQQLDLSDQMREIAALREELQQARGQAAHDTQSADVARLQAENDELRLYLAALVRLLASKGAITPDELRQMVAAVDSEDGLPDSRYRGSIE